MENVLRFGIGLFKLRLRNLLGLADRSVGRFRNKMPN